MGKCRLYTAQEDEFIKQHYASMLHEDIAYMLNRTVSSIRHRAAKIGVEKKVDQRRWTDEEDKFILASKGKKLTDVAKTLGRDTSDTSKRAKFLGIKNWRRPDGGNYVDAHGYETKFRKGRAILAHREAIENAIGRKLESEEIVHHIDCNKDNNAIGNLHLFRNASEHAKCHWSLHKATEGNELRCSEFLRSGAIRFNTDKGIYERNFSKE